MLNIKWGVTCSIAAFVIAILLSLFVGNTNFVVALLRGLSFAGLFFLLGIGAWALINHFIPEILSPQSGPDATSTIFSDAPAGSRINITLGEPSEAALPEKEGEPHDIDEVEDIGDLVSGNLKRPPKRAAEHIDQSPETSYTEESGGFAPAQDDFSAAHGGGGDFSMDFSSFVSDSGGEHSGSESGTDGAHSDFDAFTLPSGGAGDSSDEDRPQRKASRNKPEKFEGDFDAKEIAAGLRTVLQKDK
jgi:hypothetical protein